MADKAQTWVYTEDYVAESDALTAARAVSSELGASPVSSGTGAALRMLAAVAGARAVLEVGTGAGVSGLWLLDGMAPDGVLTTIDVESELLGHARRNFAAAGLSSHRTRLIAGRALDVLPRMAARGYDMVVLDGDLDETPQYLDHAVRILRPGGRYVIHELAMRPDSIGEEPATEIRKALARAISVNARPLTVADWRRALEEVGLIVEETRMAPMALLKPGRMIADEGVRGALRIARNVVRVKDLRGRVATMARTFKKYDRNLCGVAIVARKPKESQ
mgnify:CR=1 FL=1